MRRVLFTVAGPLLLALVFSPAANAAFGPLPGYAGFDARATEPDDPAYVAGPAPGGPANKAGSHPDALTFELGLEQAPGSQYSDGDLKDLRIDLPPGLVENPAALINEPRVWRCSLTQFTTPRSSSFQENRSGESCPLKTQIGIATLRTATPAGAQERTFGLFSLVSEPGVPATIGFNPYGTPVTFERRIDAAGGAYRLSLEARDFSQALNVTGLTLTLWGNPWLVSHDLQRGNCLNEADPENGFGVPGTLEEEPPHEPPPSYSPGTCSIGNPAVDRPRAYLTLPSICDGPLNYSLTVSSWQQPGVAVTRSVQSHDEAGNPLPLVGCAVNFFNSKAAARLSTDRTSSATGLDFDLDVDQTALAENTTERGRVRPGVRAPSQVRVAVARLPEGISINPSVGAGLGVCTPAQYVAETATSPPGAGCPQTAKLGEITVSSPLFESAVKGGIFLAEPYANPFSSLLAIYMVAKVPERGVMIKVPGQIDPDPRSGQITATFTDLPQLPYTHFNAHFREGQRSLLATPPSCGAHKATLSLSPWLDATKNFQSDAYFNLSQGVGGGPCPSGWPLPFAPAAEAGNLNQNAGSYTPFYLHPTRGDAEQEFTSYSAQLPPGLLGKIAGVPFCPEAAIARAAQNSGFAETASPSCPEAAKIGRTTAGYGFGSVLAYAPGNLYLAGPYNGAPLSIVAIDSATVGPFDLGVVIVRSAIKVDPRTARVTIDSQGSDPIPHILKGIPLHLRDIRVYINRPNFTVNPTNCERFSVASTLTGSGASFSSSADDPAASVPWPFQVGFCNSLDFKPKIELRLKGGTKRAKNPALIATVTPRPGDANIAKSVVTMPPSLFLDQSHIQTICTRPQSAAGKCPPGSIYGRASALTPLMGEPLEGPVYLRASDTTVPDLVADLSGRGIRVEVVGRIDSKNGGMRASYEVLPDAPVSKFTLTLNGGKRGLLVNSEDICRSAPATARISAQNGKEAVLKPRLLNSKCSKAKKKHRGDKKKGAKKKGGRK